MAGKRTKSLSLRLPVYMDYQATTPMDPAVLAAMQPYFTEKFGNPHSREHAYGWEAEAAVEKAREQVAALIGAESSEIVFTSGATESNNMALQGVARFYKAQKNHIITVATEHRCVLDTCRYLEREGFRVTYVPVQPNGVLDINRLEDAITDKTVLVSVMAVNNEIGVIQPLQEIGQLCRARGVFFHSDAAQGFGKTPLNVQDTPIDVMSISGHKIYGPKGIGALYIRRRPKVRLVPIIHGGGQEKGLRSGTLPTPLVVGLGEASRLAQQLMPEESNRIHALTQALYQGIVKGVSDVVLNGDAVARVAGNLNISFGGLGAESLIVALKNLAVSAGSACSSANQEPSYVLKALGVHKDFAKHSVRFGLGRFTTQEEVEYAVTLVCETVERLRSSSISQCTGKN